MAQAPDNNTLRERINRYTPGSTLQNSTHGYNHVSLQLFGLAGQGKTSLINSCVYVVKNQGFHNVAGAAKADGGMTMSRTNFHLTDTLSIIDNRGFSKCKEEENLEACAQLRGLRNMGEVNWKETQDLTYKIFLEKYREKPADFIVPVFVCSGRFPMKEIYSDILKFVTSASTITGIYPIVVITHSANSNTNEISGTFGDMGVVHRFALENYTENNHQRNEEADVKILKFLNKCLDEAERGITLRENEKPKFRFIRQAADQFKQENDNLEKDKKSLQQEAHQLKKVMVIVNNNLEKYMESLQQLKKENEKERENDEEKQNDSCTLQ